MNFYVTITGIKHYFGKDIFQVGQKLFLFKEPSNQFDSEAIKVCARAVTVIQSENELGEKTIIKLPHFQTVGYIANSIKTVYKGTMSSGRIYDKVPDKFTAKVMFITNTSVIAKVSLDISNMFDSIFDIENLDKSLEKSKYTLSQLEELDKQLDEITNNLNTIFDNDTPLPIFTETTETIDDDDENDFYNDDEFPEDDEFYEDDTLLDFSKYSDNMDEAMTDFANKLKDFALNNDDDNNDEEKKD